MSEGGLPDRHVMIYVPITGAYLAQYLIYAPYSGIY